MTKKKDGGQAFPHKETLYRHTYDEYEKATRTEVAGEKNVSGMSLRDYFAAKAMQGIIASPICTTGGGWDDHAKYAYGMADAMIKQRNKD